MINELFAKRILSYYLLLTHKLSHLLIRKGNNIRWKAEKAIVGIPCYIYIHFELFKTENSLNHFVLGNERNQRRRVNVQTLDYWVISLKEILSDYSHIGRIELFRCKLSKNRRILHVHERTRIKKHKFLRALSIYKILQCKVISKEILNVFDCHPTESICYCYNLIIQRSMLVRIAGFEELLQKHFPLKKYFLFLNIFLKLF